MGSADLISLGCVQVREDLCLRDARMRRGPNPHRVLTEEALVTWRESSAEPLRFKCVGCGEPRVNTKLNDPLLLP